MLVTLGSERVKKLEQEQYSIMYGQLFDLFLRFLLLLFVHIEYKIATATQQRRMSRCLGNSNYRHICFIGDIDSSVTTCTLKTSN